MMVDCPTCHQAIEAQAVICPHCRTPLKAYGHPGIPLHRAQGQEFLCQSCTYHTDDTCTFPKRPYARDCTLYHDQTQPLTGAVVPALSWQRQLSLWMQRHTAILALMGLLLISFLIALARR